MILWLAGEFWGKNMSASIIFNARAQGPRLATAALVLITLLPQIEPNHVSVVHVPACCRTY
jgi:hypothetical protein